MLKALALVIVLGGIAGGLALGVALRPGEELQGAARAVARDGDPGADGANPGAAGAGREYVKIGRQIVVPVVDRGETRALMLFDLVIDVPRSLSDRAFAAKPRLRDAFLRVLFEMSYTGAFSGTYTDERVVEELRAKLRAAARRLLGGAVDDVLILEIMRQEL